MATRPAHGGESPTSPAHVEGRRSRWYVALVPKVRIVLLILVFAAAVPAAANAAITVGPANPNPKPSVAVSASYPSGVLLFTKTAPPAAVLVAPSEGVITSWRLYTDDVGPGATAQLYALTAVGEEHRVDAIGSKESVPPVKAEGTEDQNVLPVFSARLPVAAGALLGARLEYTDSGNPLKPVYYLDPIFSFGTMAAPPPVGGSAKAASYVGYLAMNATLEPDADHDGYGDETQDSCVGVCAPPAPIATVVAPPATTKKKCKKGKKLKRGKCVKKKRKHHKKPGRA